MDDEPAIHRGGAIALADESDAAAWHPVRRRTAAADDGGTVQSNQIVITGNLVAHPDFQQVGEHVKCRFRLASTERRFDRSTQEWVDGQTVFLRVNAWRRLADNVLNSVTKGDRVVVVGRLVPSDYEKDGVQHRGFEIEADSVAVDLGRLPAKVQRAQRSSADDGPTDDRWATAAPSVDADADTAVSDDGSDADDFSEEELAGASAGGAG